MGRWAQAARRGGVGPDKTGIGPSAPVSGQFSVSSGVATHITVTGLTAFPAGVSGFRASATDQAGGAVTTGNNQPTFNGTIDLSPLVSGHTYNVVTWYTDASGVQSSSVSPAKVQVCL